MRLGSECIESAWNTCPHGKSSFYNHTRASLLQASPDLLCSLPMVQQAAIWTSVIWLHVVSAHLMNCRNGLNNIALVLQLFPEAMAADGGWIVIAAASLGGALCNGLISCLSK